MILPRLYQLVEILLHVLHHHVKKACSWIVERLEDWYDMSMARNEV